MNRFSQHYVIKTLLIVVALLASGCNLFTKKEVTGAQAPAMVVLDVNDDRIYQDAHIAGATHIPYDKIETLDKHAQNWDKSKSIVVYCTNYMCLASKDVAKKLKALGFSDVRVYSGGVAEWHQLHQKDKGFQIEGPQQELYLKKELTPSQPEDATIVTISAQDLRKKMVDAGLLK